MQVDILNKLRRETLKQPSLFTIRHYHRPLVRSCPLVPVKFPCDSTVLPITGGIGHAHAPLAALRWLIAP